MISPALGRVRATSATRSVPLRQPLEVITTSPKPDATLAIRASSVATITRENAPLSWHRRQTCSIIVLPAIIARDLPGNRVDPYRAGMIATGALPPTFLPDELTARRKYRLSRVASIRPGPGEANLASPRPHF